MGLQEDAYRMYTQDNLVSVVETVVHEARD